LKRYLTVTGKRQTFDFDQIHSFFAGLEDNCICILPNPPTTT
jgi:hypothetical protein